jgi:hypothetical protein
MKSNMIWVAISCLAVGFIVGREMTRAGGGGGGAPGAATPTSANGPTDVPKDWIVEGDIGATATFQGMTPQQRYAALKVLNERPCDCGCPHGSVAKCKKDDPGCPRAPKVIEDVVALAKQGKTAPDILAAVKKPDAPAAQQPKPDAPQRAELAAWTPVKGPKYAKVTIVEYSDFQ